MFKEITNLVKDEKFVVLDNGSIIKKNIDLKYTNNTFYFEEDIELVLINRVTDYEVLNIEVKNNSHVKVVEICLFDLSDSYLDKNVKCLENSSLELVEFDLSTNTNSKANVKTYLDESSYINSKKISLFANNSNVDERIYLKGKDANFLASNVYINYNNGEQNIDYTIYHQDTDTKSELFNYGICKNKSVLNINTNGVVEKDAVRSDLKQKTKGVLLDLESSISANPLLQIDEYDCLASHGAGIGAIDEEDLYYLMSRGLSREEASKLIIAGFTFPVIESFPEGKIKEFVIATINKYL